MPDIFKKNETMQPEYDEATQSLLRAIEEQKKKDPLAGLNIGAGEINKRMFDIFKNDTGVNIDITLRVLAALAGFSCQVAVRETFINTDKVSEKEAFMTVTGKDGNTYYMGGLLNKPLAEDEYSIWSLVAGAVKEAGGEIPDLEKIAKHGAKTVGTEDFGKARVDEKHLTGDSSQNFVKAFWPKFLPMVDLFCDNPMQRPILYAIAIHKLILQAKNSIDPQTAAILCMDTAVAMSKIDPKSLDD